MKFLNFFNSTGIYTIRMTQNFLDKSKVEAIKKQMTSNKFNFMDDKNKIAYDFINNVYYITEGYHRMQAALEIWKESENYEYIKKLISNGIKYEVNKPPYKSWRFKI